MVRRAILIAAALTLASCGSPRHAPMESAEFGVAMEAPSPAAAARSADIAQAPKDGAPRPGVSLPLLAYDYAATLELPAAAVAPLLRQHEAACKAAGPAKCLVIGASTQAYGEDDVSGQLELRAEPTWLAGFRTGLEGEAEAARGRLRDTSVTAEDLTTQIVDTEARLRALETLRTRLEALLRDRPGKLAELLDLERELARVQGELDATRSTLAVMRQRVEMSRMTVTYASKPKALRGGVFDPISGAGADFFRIIAEVVGFLIRLVAVLLPLAIVLAPLVWLSLRLWRHRRPKAMATPDAA